MGGLVVAMLCRNKCRGFWLLAEFSTMHLVYIRLFCPIANAALNCVLNPD